MLIHTSLNPVCTSIFFQYLENVYGVENNKMASFEKTMNVQSFRIAVSNTIIVDRIWWIGARNEIR
jgi:hypothetical protein